MARHITSTPFLPVFNINDLEQHDLSQGLGLGVRSVLVILTKDSHSLYSEMNSGDGEQLLFAFELVDKLKTQLTGLSELACCAEARLSIVADSILSNLEQGV